MDFDGFWWILMDFNGFWWILMDFNGFWWVLEIGIWLSPTRDFPFTKNSGWIGHQNHGALGSRHCPNHARAPQRHRCSLRTGFVSENVHNGCLWGQVAPQHAGSLYFGADHRPYPVNSVNPMKCPILTLFLPQIFMIVVATLNPSSHPQQSYSCLENSEERLTPTILVWSC